MEKKFLIPNSPLIFIELKRLLDKVYADNTNEFDLFENDIFVIYDPIDDVQEDLHEEEISPSEIIDPEMVPFDSNDHEELLNEAIRGISHSEDNDEDDCCSGGEIPFSVMVPFNPGKSSAFSDLPIFSMDDDEDDIPPNFIHKPTNLKVWWKLGDDQIYSNTVLHYKKLSNIINQCIASLGRMTDKYIVRYQYWGEEGDERM